MCCQIIFQCSTMHFCMQSDHTHAIKNLAFHVVIHESGQATIMSSSAGQAVAFAIHIFKNTDLPRLSQKGSIVKSHLPQAAKALFAVLHATCACTARHIHDGNMFRVCVCCVMNARSEKLPFGTHF